MRWARLRETELLGMGCMGSIHRRHSTVVIRPAIQTASTRFEALHMDWWRCSALLTDCWGLQLAVIRDARHHSAQAYHAAADQTSPNRAAMAIAQQWLHLRDGSSPGSQSLRRPTGRPFRPQGVT